MTDFADRARAAMEKQGMTVRGVARTLNYDAAFVSRVLNRKQQPSPKLAQLLDQFLSTDGALTELASPLTAEDSARIAHSIVNPARVDAETVRALAEALAVQRRLDDSLGSAAVLAPTLAQLGTVNALAAAAGNAEVGQRLRSVTAEWVRFAGWLHASLRRDGEAVRLFARAEELADEANDPVTAALAVSFRGYVARQRGNWPGVIRASAAARESPGAHHTQRTFDTLQAAQGHAGLSDSLTSTDGVGARRHRDAARRLLGDASSMIGDMTGDKAIPPPSVYWYSPTFFRMNIGLAHLGLGDMTDAVESLSAGLAGLPKEHRETEWTQEYRDALQAANEAA